VETARGEGLQVQSPTADEQLHLLAEQMPAILWTTDQNLRITSNLGAGFGPSQVKANDWAGRTLYDYLKCQDPHAAPIAQHAEALRGVSSYFEYQHGNHHFAVHLSPLRGRQVKSKVASPRASTLQNERSARIRSVTKRHTMR
jgi:hypothetical protein